MKEQQRQELASFHRNALMDDMMQVVGVDWLDAADIDGGRSYIRARGKCLGCESKAECRSWLAGCSDGVPRPVCPNAEFFRAVRGDA